MQKYTKNDVIEILSEAIADRLHLRGVIDFGGEHEHETMLIDFSNGGEEPLQAPLVCQWDTYRSFFDDDDHFGTEDMDSGTFEQYDALFDFIIQQLDLAPGSTLYVESY